MDSLTVQVREFIGKNFLFDGGVESLSDDASFLDQGIIDSTGVLELVEWIEETFGVVIDDMELIPENLDSVRNIVAFVQQKLSAGKDATV